MAATRKRRKPRRVSVERKFAVKAGLANFTLAKAKSALTLQIYSHGEKLGELQVGRGSLYWSGANRKSEKRVPWEAFAQMMDELAYGKQ